MIPVKRPPVPEEFERKCAVRGRRWVEDHPGVTAGMPDCWRRFVIPLPLGFGNRCGYLAMRDMNGTVDHYLSTEEHPEEAYNWANYRYATGWLNSSKQTVDRQVLDPFEVREEWFEIDLASLHLKLTPAIPAKVRARAEYTLERLKLDCGPRVISTRETYLEEYREGKYSLDHLADIAPLLATAVRRDLLLQHLEAHRSVSAEEAGPVCQVALARAAELLHIWSIAGHIAETARKGPVRYRLPARPNGRGRRGL